MTVVVVTAAHFSTIMLCVRVSTW